MPFDLTILNKQAKSRSVGDPDPTAGMFVGIADGEVFHQISIMAKVPLMGGIAQVHPKGRVVRPLAVLVDSFSTGASDR